MDDQEDARRPNNFAADQSCFASWHAHNSVILAFWDGRGDPADLGLESARYVIPMSPFQALILSHVLVRHALAQLAEGGEGALHRSGDSQTTTEASKADKPEVDRPGPGDGLDLWRKHLADLDLG